MKKSEPANILLANLAVIAALALLWPTQWFVQKSGVLDSYAQRIIMLIGIRIVAAVSLQLINGISGQFSLGHAGFMAIGAYSAAYPAIHLSHHFASPLSSGLMYALLLTGGGVCAAVAGLIVGIPALRLRGDYLAIATLGFAEIVRVLLETSEPLGRAIGLPDIPKVTGFLPVYTVVVLSVAAIWRFARSARGRAMLAVRDDEIAAASVGINPARSKVVAFIIGAFFAGVSGAMLAQYEGYIAPANFNFMQSIELVVIVTLAGAGSISGTIVMTAILTWLPEQLRFLAEYRMIIYSLLLIIMMLLRPNGILGSRELFDVFGWLNGRRGTVGDP